MHIGQFEIEQLSEGIFEVFGDATVRKIDSMEITSNRSDAALQTGATAIGVDPILIRSGSQNILLDTGLGWGLDHKSRYTDTSNLKTNLDIFGLKPEDITHVVLSHLHFDHAAGSTYVTPGLSTTPTLPNAHYFVQKLEWLYAVEQALEDKESEYRMDELYKLHAEDKLVLITDTYFELIPGITLIKTGGHTPGHQIVKIQSEGKTAYYLGDLVPNELHLNYYRMDRHDTDPVASRKARSLILRQALKERATLLFYHSIHVKSGVLVSDEEHRYALAEGPDEETG